MKKPYSIPLALHYLRMSKNMTQSQLAQEVGIGQDYVSRIEKDLKKPTVETLERLLDVFDVSFSEFFQIAEKLCEPETDQEIARLVKSKGKLRKEILGEILFPPSP